MEWQRLVDTDVRRLGVEVLLHICNDSCHQYSGSKTTQICHHGFYYVVSLAEWRRRRKGKASRDSAAIVTQCKFGMQGRMLEFQEHPFECQKNYAALAALRYTFDMQDLRRVLPEQNWLTGKLPHLGDRGKWGYTRHYEWNGDEWLARHDESRGALPDEPMRGSWMERRGHGAMWSFAASRSTAWMSRAVPPRTICRRWKPR